jgi:hypothetical protein
LVILKPTPGGRKRRIRDPAAIGFRKKVGELFGEMSA